MVTMQKLKDFFKKIVQGALLKLSLFVLGYLSSSFYSYVTRPPENICHSKRDVIMGRFHYDWDIEVNADSASRMVIYPKSDFFVNGSEIVRSPEVYAIQPIGQFSNGKFVGFLAKFEAPKNKRLNFKFKTYSSEPLKDNSCENFLFSL